MSKENKLLTAFTTFMIEHGVECAEDIYQNDTVDEDSLSLIEDLFNIVDIHTKCDNKQTNADRIRAMSDKELADTLFNSCLEVMHIDECPYADNVGMCKKCISEWLQSEAE